MTPFRTKLARKRLRSSPGNSRLSSTSPSFSRECRGAKSLQDFQPRLDLIGMGSSAAEVATAAVDVQIALATRLELHVLDSEQHIVLGSSDGSR